MQDGRRDPARGNTLRSVAPRSSYDLVIMLPADVRFWVAAKTVEEDLELRLQLRCNRLARKPQSH